MIQLSQREEDLVSKAGQDPTFHDLDGNLHLGFVFGFSRSCRDHRHLIVFRQLLVGRVELRIVATGFGDRAFQVIRHQDFRYTAEELQHTNMAEQPILQRLGVRRFDPGVVGGTQTSTLRMK
ncbi:hypothetical protein D3C72_1726090 [compost metagenome]